MRWQMGRRSRNVEDHTGSGRGLSLPGRRTARVGGVGGIGLLVIAVVMLLFGIDPSFLFQGGGPVAVPEDPFADAGSGPPAELDSEIKAFMSAVLADTEDTWGALFEQGGQTYREPTLVLFTGTVSSACGYAEAASGPFYCPADQKVYLDTTFFEELARRFQAPGDFAQAYVLAHEIGHHVQTLLGVSRQVQELRQQVDGAEGNRLSVMMELQADCLAGVWAHHAHNQRQILEEGDIEEALGAASAIGDDRLQRRSQGFVVPESFTHGSAEQRARWFRNGLRDGSLQSCDTFNAPGL